MSAERQPSKEPRRQHEGPEATPSYRIAQPRSEHQDILVKLASPRPPIYEEPPKHGKVKQALRGEVFKSKLADTIRERAENLEEQHDIAQRLGITDPDEKDYVRLLIGNEFVEDQRRGRWGYDRKKDTYIAIPNPRIFNPLHHPVNQTQSAHRAMYAEAHFANAVHTASENMASANRSREQMIRYAVHDIFSKGFDEGRQQVGFKRTPFRSFSEAHVVLDPDDLQQRTNYWQGQINATSPDSESPFTFTRPDPMDQPIPVLIQDIQKKWTNGLLSRGLGKEGFDAYRGIVENRVHRLNGRLDLTDKADRDLADLYLSRQLTKNDIRLWRQRLGHPVMQAVAGRMTEIYNIIYINPAEAKVGRLDTAIEEITEQNYPPGSNRPTLIRNAITDLVATHEKDTLAGVRMRATGKVLDAWGAEHKARIVESMPSYTAKMPDHLGKDYEDNGKESYRDLQRMYEADPVHVMRPKRLLRDGLGRVRGYRTEQVDGQTAQDYKESHGEFPDHIIEQMRSTLEALHENGIIHGSPTLQHIIITRDEIVKFTGPAGHGVIPAGEFPQYAALDTEILNDLLNQEGQGDAAGGDNRGGQVGGGERVRSVSYQELKETIPQHYTDSELTDAVEGAVRFALGNDTEEPQRIARRRFPLSRRAEESGIDDNAETEIELAPNVLYAKTKEDYERLVREVIRQTRGDEGDIPDLVDHEEEHAKYARILAQYPHHVRQVGADDVFYGIAVSKNITAAGEFFWHVDPFTIAPDVTSVLGQLAIAGYPEDPSPNDMNFLHMWGVSDIDDLGERIAHSNRVHGTEMPLPSSHEGPSGRAGQILNSLAWRGRRFGMTLKAVARDQFPISGDVGSINAKNRGEEVYSKPNPEGKPVATPTGEQSEALGQQRPGGRPPEGPSIRGESEENPHDGTDVINAVANGVHSDIQSQWTGSHGSAEDVAFNISSFGRYKAVTDDERSSIIINGRNVALPDGLLVASVSFTPNGLTDIQGHEEQRASNVIAFVEGFSALVDELDRREAAGELIPAVFITETNETMARFFNKIGFYRESRPTGFATVIASTDTMRERIRNLPASDSPVMDRLRRLAEQETDFMPLRRSKGERQAINEELRAAHEARYDSDFAPEVTRLENEIADYADPREHPDFLGIGGEEGALGVMAFRIGTAQNPTDKSYVLRIPPSTDSATGLTVEEERYEALLVGSIRLLNYDTEKIIAHKPQDERTITEYAGVPSHEIPLEDWARIANSPDILKAARDTLLAMGEEGLEPDLFQHDNFVWNGNRVVFIDYNRLEESGETDSVLEDFARFSSRLAAACPDESMRSQILRETLQLVQEAGITDEKYGEIAETLRGGEPAVNSEAHDDPEDPGEGTGQVPVGPGDRPPTDSGAPAELKQPAEPGEVVRDQKAIEGGTEPERKAEDPGHDSSDDELDQIIERADQPEAHGTSPVQQPKPDEQAEPSVDGGEKQLEQPDAETIPPVTQPAQAPVPEEEMPERQAPPVTPTDAPESKVNPSDKPEVPQQDKKELEPPPVTTDAPVPREEAEKQPVPPEPTHPAEPEQIVPSPEEHSAPEPEQDLDSQGDAAAKTFNDLETNGNDHGRIELPEPSRQEPPAPDPGPSTAHDATEPDTVPEKN